MNLRLLVALLFAVAASAVAVKWQSERERSGQFDVARPLLGDLSFSRVSRMHVANIERGSDFALGVDSVGVWYLTDPVAYRADAGLIELLRQAVDGQQALSPPDPNADLVSLGLDPPQVEWTLYERVGAEERLHRLAIGGPDPSGSRVYVMKDGALFLASRSIANTLNKDFQDYRSARISEVDPSKVVEVHRSGRIQFSAEEEPVDLSLSALREGASWRALRPQECLLDPMDLSLVLVGAARLSFEQYIEEPEVELRAYGLDQPEVRVELRSSDGVSDTILLGRPAVGGVWYGKRLGGEDVYRLRSRDAVILAYPFEAMIDRRLVRALPEDVTGVRFDSPEGLIRLAREGDLWTVSVDEAAALPAEAFVVRELLSWISDAEFEPLDPTGVDLDLDGLERSLVLELNEGEVGGRFTSATEGSRSGLLRFRRFGDDVVSRLDDGLLDWLDRPSSAWWSLSLLELDELRVTELRLAIDGDELLYRRGSRGRWRDSKGREAVELLPWLDPLLFLRATERMDREEAEGLERAMSVQFTLSDGSARSYLLAAGEALTTVCEIGPVRAVLLRSDLFAGLVGLFP